MGPRKQTLGQDLCKTGLLRSVSGKDQKARGEGRRSSKGLISQVSPLLCRRYRAWGLSSTLNPAHLGEGQGGGGATPRSGRGISSQALFAPWEQVQLLEMSASQELVCRTPQETRGMDRAQPGSSCFRHGEAKPPPLSQGQVPRPRHQPTSTRLHILHTVIQPIATKAQP